MLAVLLIAQTCLVLTLALCCYQIGKLTEIAKSRGIKPWSREFFRFKERKADTNQTVM